MVDQNTAQTKIHSNAYMIKLKKAARIYKKEGIRSFVNECWLVAIRPWRVRREKKIWDRLVAQNINKRPMVIVHEQEMFLNPCDKGISIELACYQAHEPLSTKMMKSIINEGDTIIDIGANIGYFVLLESQLVGTKGKVIAIEPSAENIKLLKVNIEENKLNNVDVLELAIGGYDGNGTLYLSEACNWNTLVLQPELNQTASTEVKVRTIDYLVKEMGIEPSLVRMDLEGYETEAIKGMMHTLNSYSPQLIIELHPQLIGGEATRDLILTLHAIGYEVVYAINKERDYPWNASVHAIESPTIKCLANDKRITEEKRGFIVFFRKRIVERSA